MQGIHSLTLSAHFFCDCKIQVLAPSLSHCGGKRAIGVNKYEFSEFPEVFATPEWGADSSWSVQRALFLQRRCEEGPTRQGHASLHIPYVPL